MQSFRKKKETWEKNAETNKAKKLQAKLHLNHLSKITNNSYDKSKRFNDIHMKILQQQQQN